ncbi:hypothetical protein OEB99_16665 [Actinotalea sp. M2MS4P-6]|uniref:hypothetical protein n=1 Tax=Actinotalea sp. M2MS4P-6 TaxID=2983762 RepID=UPI0021E45092|nr:hypothetical protein [Actinotalea sp. M2MS4P-6]MCV2395950.1 hypothetical protein [Actinotalea sp. M2MS4P-6]
MATPEPNTTPIARPRVPIRKLDDDRHRAECQHCPWTIEGATTVRAEIEGTVAYHPHQHQAGRIEATR